MTHHFLKFLPLLQQLVVKLGAHRTETGNKYNLTNMSMGVLGAIKFTKNCIMGDVAEQNLITLPAASRMVEQLVKEKLINRIPDNVDRRKIHLEFTIEGNRIFELVHRELGKLLEQLLDMMSQDDQDSLERGLLASVRVMQENDNLSRIKK